jgi:hypothetical protein
MIKHRSIADLVQNSQPYGHRHGARVLHQRSQDTRREWHSAHLPVIGSRGGLSHLKRNKPGTIVDRVTLDGRVGFDGVKTKQFPETVCDLYRLEAPLALVCRLLFLIPRAHINFQAASVNAIPPRLTIVSSANHIGQANKYFEDTPSPSVRGEGGLYRIQVNPPVEPRCRPSHSKSNKKDVPAAVDIISDILQNSKLDRPPLKGSGTLY